MSKEYLGDSVYVDFDGFGLVLTTENGYHDDPRNRIVLEPAVYEALKGYVERLNQTDSATPHMAYSPAELDELRTRLKCPELYLLVTIPEEDIKSGRHSMAECHSPDCHNPVRYRLAVESFDELLDTEYFCEAHKPIGYPTASASQHLPDAAQT